MTSPNRKLAVVAPHAFWLAGESTGDLQNELEHKLSPHGFETKLYHAFNEDPRQLALKADVGTRAVKGLVIANFSEAKGAVELDQPVKEAAKTVVPAELPIFVMSAVGLGDLEIPDTAEVLAFGNGDGWDTDIIVERLIRDRQLIDRAA